MITYRGTVLSRLPNGMIQISVNVYEYGRFVKNVVVQASDNYKISSVNQVIGEGGLPVRQTSSDNWVIG